MLIFFRKWTVLVLLFCYCMKTYSRTIQDLGGTWRLIDYQKNYHLMATVPGGIYTDLVKTGILEDIFYDFNDINTRWVSKLDWSYSKVFIVESGLLAHKKVNLVFDGVDTFSKITVNNVEVGKTDNMFVRYIFDVTKYIQLGENNITVEFKSPVNTSKALYEKQAKDYIIPPKCIPSTYNGECHVNHIRKMQASFAWDWGPAFPSVGIWKNVYLEAYDIAILRDVTVSTHNNTKTNNWDVQFNVYLQESQNCIYIQGELYIEISTNDGILFNKSTINRKKNKQAEFVAIQNISIPTSQVQLWWPNGYGEAKLYQVKVSYVSSNGEESFKILQIGFRTVELVQDPIMKDNSIKGTTFYFKVNKLPIFAKGSNIIPISILPELGQNETKIRFLLKSAKDAHMNMLRVWGGGVYESDRFYEIADEMGIMIWQDFMFACSMYPINEEFISTVLKEVRHQVRRLQYHPSIVLWAGNNENEVALRQNWYGTRRNFSLYKEDYVKLYVDIVKPEVLLNDHTRPYLVSSPTNGIKSEQDGHIALNPQSNYYGDVHFYMYFLDSWEKIIYPINRFASEYGFQSLPSISTLLTATNKTENLHIHSPFLKSRQHRPFGFIEMRILLFYQLQLPNETSMNFYKAFIFFSQIVQAMSVKIQTELYRQWRSSLSSTGKGFTMGALYWQLNDVWVAPSWSGIDFKNNWKMLHYYAKNFFAPIIVVGDLDNRNNLDVHVISDLMETIFNASVIIKIFRWDSLIPLKQYVIETDVLPSMSRKIETLPIEFDSSCYGTGNKIRNCFIYFTIANNTNQEIAPDNYVFPAKLKAANLTYPTSVAISNLQQVDEDGKTFVIEIKTNEIALFVWLDTNGISGRFSDNGFMQVTPKKTINFYSEQPITVEDLQQHLTITHLQDREYL